MFLRFGSRCYTSERVAIAEQRVSRVSSESDKQAETVEYHRTKFNLILDPAEGKESSQAPRAERPISRQASRRRGR